jgi:polyferredoxin
MITSSVVGIICIIIGLTIWPEFDEFQERYFTTLLYDMTYKEKVLSNLVISFFKILIIIYWPKNLSFKAFLVSISWVISYLVMLKINGKYNGKGIGNNSNIQ